MQFSFLDFKMNDELHFTHRHLITVASLPCETRNTKNAREHNFVL